VVDGAYHDVIRFHSVENPVSLKEVAAVAGLKVIGTAAHVWNAGDKVEDTVESSQVFFRLRRPEVLFCVVVYGEKLATG
jgi:hypothetical protein